MNRVELTLRDVIASLRRCLIWICLTTLLFTLGAWVYSEYFVTPLYTTQISMCVFSGQRGEAGVTTGDLSADAAVANTYRILLTSQPVLAAVSEELNGELPPAAIGGMLSVSSTAQILYVTVTGSDPACIVRVADALSEVAPTAIGELARAGEMVAVDRAVMPKAPSYPNIPSNVATGFLLGLLLSCVVAVLLALLDTTVRREEELERAFDSPVLGSVPNMSSAAPQSGKDKKRRR